MDFRSSIQMIQIKQCFRYSLHLVILFVLCLTNSLFGQETDSLKTEPDKSIRSTWFNRPPSGKSEKTQGGILMALGASGVLAGVILMNKKDPCDDVSGSFVFCTNNIDEVRTQGAVALGIGAGAIIYGIIRYSAGSRKARAFDEWKKKNKLSFKPELGFEKTYVRLRLAIGF